MYFFHRGKRKVRYEMMSFDLVGKYIESFRGIYLPFEHYIFTAQTTVDDYLILPKVFLESDQFGDPRPVGQIDTGSREYGLDYLAYLPAFSLRLQIRIIFHLRYRYY